MGRHNASFQRPKARLERQYKAKATTQPLWRAIMPKLLRAGMVSTNALLALLSPPATILHVCACENIVKKNERALLQ